MQARSRLLLWLAAAAVAAVFFIDLCSWIYDCGCRSLWAGADEHCNIHMPAGRRCPLCMGGFATGTAVFVAIAGVQASLVWGFPRLTRVARIALAFAAFPITEGVLAAVIGLFTGYWDN